MLLAQLSDSHVLGPSNDEPVYVDNNGRLAAAIEALVTEDPSPDAVLATGDLAQWGRPDEYRNLAELVAPLEVPYLPIPGNHDTREGVRSAFPDVGWVDAAHASWVTDIEEFTVIGLDSTKPGAEGGQFDTDRERWLSDVLADGDGPMVLALHHPPFASGIRWMDAAGFEGLDRLTGLLADQERVIRVLCGHLHRLVNSTVAGIPVQTAPSTIQHVGLDLRDDAPVSLINDPAGYLLHCYRDGAWVTHTRFVAHGEEPYSPHWG